MEREDLPLGDDDFLPDDPDFPRPPYHACEVAVGSPTPHECCLVFLEVEITPTIEGGTVNLKTQLTPGIMVAIPWATAEGLHTALGTELEKRRAAVEKKERMH